MLAAGQLMAQRLGEIAEVDPPERLDPRQEVENEAEALMGTVELQEADGIGVGRRFRGFLPSESA